MACLKQRNPKIQSFDTECYASRSQNIGNDMSMTWKLASSREKPLLHHINEQFLDDTNDKISLVYIRV